MSLFYNTFLNQELILKFNTLDFNKQISLDKCKVYVIKEDKLQNVSCDLRYLLEFLTNTKIRKSKQDDLLINIKINKKECYNLFLYFTYLIYVRSSSILGSKFLEYNYPVLQKSNKVKKLISKRYKSYFDITFKSGLNLPFLSDNDYISNLASEFSIRFIFKRIVGDKFSIFKFLSYFTVLGLKQILILNLKNINEV